MPFRLTKTPQVNIDRFAIFRSLSQEEKEKLQSGARLQKVKAGSVIFSEKTVGDAFYLVDKGRVEISKTGIDGRKRKLAVLGEGELFGELAVYDHDVRSATATAIEDSRIISFPSEAIAIFIQGMPEIVQGFLETQIIRLRKINEKILQMEEVQKMQEKVIASIEGERKRIARDVHDGPVQEIGALVLKLDALEMHMQKDADKAKEIIQEVKKRLMEVLKNIRRFIFDLHPLTLESKGLKLSLEELAQKWQAENKPEISVSVTAKNIKPHLATVFFAITQEALNNIAKHAQAKKVEVSIEESEGKLSLLIKDDGIGFNVEKVLKGDEQRESLGLSGMKERAELVGGTFKINSAQGRGTEIRVEIQNGQ